MVFLRIRLYLILAFFVAVAAQPLPAQWQDVSVPGYTLDLYGLYALDADNCCVVGWTGQQAVIAWTTDAGDTWMAEDASGDFYFGAYFHDTNTGFVVGYDPGCNCALIMKTTDGGNSWTRQNLPSGHPAYSFGLYRIEFADAMNAYTCGYNGLIARTTDGGETWTRGNTGTENSIFRAMDVVDKDHVYAAGGPSFNKMTVVYKTADGGENWSVVRDFGSNSSLTNIFFLTPDTGYLTGGDSEGAFIMRTEDGGETWERIYDGANGSFVLDVSFQSATRGTALTTGNRILETQDGGETWSSSALPPGAGLLELDQAADGSIYISGSGARVLRLGATTSVHELEGRDRTRVHIYPNPIDDSATVSVTLTGGATNVTFSLHDALGREVRRMPADGGSFTLEKGSLPAGTYTYALEADGKTLATGALQIR